MNKSLAILERCNAKQSILAFIQAVTDPGSADFVPPAERIATFDNDGTLWLEKPLYIQLQHGLRGHREDGGSRTGSCAIASHSKLSTKKTRPGWRRLLRIMPGETWRGHYTASGIAEAFNGMTIEAFEADALEFFNNARGCSVQKALQTTDLQADGGVDPQLARVAFRSTSPRPAAADFVRSVCEEIYGHSSLHGHREQRDFRVRRGCSGVSPGDAHQRA